MQTFNWTEAGLRALAGSTAATLGFDAEVTEEADKETKTKVYRTYEIYRAVNMYVFDASAALVSSAAEPNSGSIRSENIPIRS